MQKPLVCKNCGKVHRPRNASKICPKCGKETLEVFKPKEEKKISTEAIFESSAGDSRIRVRERKFKS